VGTIPPQPTVLVTGTDGRRLRSVALELIGERATASDGAVVVTTGTAPAVLASRLIDGPGHLAPANLAVVDARDAAGDEPGVGDLDPGESDPDSDLACGHVDRVDPDADPATLEGSVATALEWLTAAGVDRRHFLYDVLGTDAGTYDRAYRVAMTVGAEEGLAVFTHGARGRQDDVVAELAHLVDVHVELREVDGATELRWTGLLGASDGWVGLAEADLGAGGFG